MALWAPTLRQRLVACSSRRARAGRRAARHALVAAVPARFGDESVELSAQVSRVAAGRPGEAMHRWSHPVRVLPFDASGAACASRSTQGTGSHALPSQLEEAVGRHTGCVLDRAVANEPLELRHGDTSTSGSASSIVGLGVPWLSTLDRVCGVSPASAVDVAVGNTRRARWIVSNGGLVST